MIWRIAGLLLAGAASAASAQLPTETVEVVGLVRTVEAGQIITEADLGPVEVPGTVARLVAMPADVLGKEAKRTIEAGKPLRPYDVMVPQLVKKGQKVSLIVQNETMTITATGKAMTAGGEGDTVRVQNSQSYVLLEGEVVGPGLVRVMPGRR